MSDSEAAALLGVAPDASWTDVRAAYRKQIRAHHPDRAGAGSSASAARIIEAYRSLESTASSTGTRTGTPRSTQPTEDDGDRADAPHGQRPVATWLDAGVTRVDVDTLTIGTPADEAFRWLLDAAGDLGEITYLDRSGPILEVLCSFADEPATSLVVTVQGRADHTEVFCTVESIEARPAPPAAAVIDCYELALRRRQGFDEPTAPPS